MITLDEIKSYLNVDFDDKDVELNDLIENSKLIIETSTGADYDIVTQLANEKLNRLYKLVQKLVIREEFEENTADSKALTAKYIKLKAYYRKVVNENGN